MATLTVDDFTVDHEGTWASVVPDAAASGGRAVKVTTVQDLPAVHFAMSNMAFDDVDYELRVETLTDDGYMWHSLGKFRPRDCQRFTFGMGRFKNGGGQNAVRAVWIDQAEIRRAE